MVLWGTNMGISKASKIQAQNFVDRCTEIYNTRTLKIPPNGFDRIPELPYPDYSAANTVPERYKTKTGSTLKSFYSVVLQVPNNLNYRASHETWSQFYTFPSNGTVEKYLEEIKETSGVDGNVLAVNANFKNMCAYTNNLVVLNQRRRCGISFLNGSTGVGKTTFLKFFVKTQKFSFLKNTNIISRIKFHDLKKQYDDSVSRSENYLQQKFSDLIINRLFRDIIDSYLIIREDLDFPEKASVINAYIHSSKRDIPEQVKKNLQAMYTHTLRHLREVELSYLENSEDSLQSRDEAYLSEIPIEFKRKIIRAADRFGFKFCIALDGFDAMRPEDISLFQDDAQADFADCLNSAITNNLAVQSPSGDLINSLNKLYLIAARPITIIELNRGIDYENDFDSVLDEQAAPFVIGSDITSILKNRIKVRIFENNKEQPPAQLFSALEKGISLITDVIYDHHEGSVEKGRFIDLFNHNIREKLVFLQSATEYLIAKVEHAFFNEKVVTGADIELPMTLERFNKLLDGNPSDLSIDLYEIQRLLLLPKSGGFRNKFWYGSAGKKMQSRREAGSFDNIFNYLPPDKRKDHPVVEESGYELKHDPLLVKFLVIKYLNNRQGRPVSLERIERWISEDHPSRRLDKLDVKVLIRSGFVRAKNVGGGLSIECTRKGIFVLNEMMSNSIYMEHVILNTMLAPYVFERFEPPVYEDRRKWAQISMVNTLWFMIYLKLLVAKLENEDKSLVETVDNMFKDLMETFVQVAGEGIENGDENYGLQMSGFLKQFTDHRYTEEI